MQNQILSSGFHLIICEACMRLFPVRRNNGRVRGKPMYSSPLCRLLSPVPSLCPCFCPFLCKISIFCIHTCICVCADVRFPCVRPCRLLSFVPMSVLSIFVCVCAEIWFSLVYDPVICSACLQDRAIAMSLSLSMHMRLCPSKMCLYPYIHTYMYLLMRCACADLYFWCVCPDVRFTLPICIHPYVVCCHLQCLWAFLAFPTPLHCKTCRNFTATSSTASVALSLYGNLIYNFKEEAFPETVKLFSDMDFPELPSSCPFKLETTPNAGRIVVATR